MLFDTNHIGGSFQNLWCCFSRGVKHENFSFINEMIIKVKQRKEIILCSGKFTSKTLLTADFSPFWLKLVQWPDQCQRRRSFSPLRTYKTLVHSVLYRRQQLSLQ